ncbi:serine/arginine-rich splicing factor SC35 protein [Trifolium repens]|nr:serine/arginine-rich splicing factor SC35 protein [Trifolium repens]
MITKIRTTGGEVAAGVMIGMNVTGTVGETGTIVAEAEAAVPVLIARVVEGGVMMMSVIVEAEANQWTAAPLHDAVLVLKGALLQRGVFPLKRVLHPGKVHVMKVLIIVAAKESLLLLAVSHHEVALMLPGARLLEIQMVMNKLSFMKYSKDTSTSVPVTVLIILDDLVNVNGLIRVLERFYDLSAVCCDREK